MTMPLLQLQRQVMSKLLSVLCCALWGMGLEGYLLALIRWGDGRRSVGWCEDGTR